MSRAIGVGGIANGASDGFALSQKMVWTARLLAPGRDPRSQCSVFAPLGREELKRGEFYNPNHSSANYLSSIKSPFFITSYSGEKISRILAIEARRTNIKHKRYNVT